MVASTPRRVPYRRYAAIDSSGEFRLVSRGTMVMIDARR